MQMDVLRNEAIVSNTHGEDGAYPTGRPPGGLLLLMMKRIRQRYSGRVAIEPDHRGGGVGDGKRRVRAGADAGSEFLEDLERSPGRS